MRNMDSGVMATVVITALAAVACAPPMAQQSTEIPALSRDWIAALNAGDVDTLVAMYTEDARVLPPNAEAGRGSEAVRASFGAMIDAGLGGELETVEAVVSGDIGYHVGKYKITSDGAEVDHGKFVETWRKTAAGWQISTDIWNSDLPAAAPAKAAFSVIHEVKDAGHWLAAWQGEDSRHGMFAEHGARGVRVFQSSEDPNLTGLVVEIDDLEAFESFITSAEAEAAKKADGVIGKTMRILAEVK